LATGVIVVLRLSSVPSSAVEVEGSAGIVKECTSSRSEHVGQRGLSICCRAQASVLLRKIEAGRGRGKSKGPWPSWGQVCDRLSAAARHQPTRRLQQVAGRSPHISSYSFTHAFTPPHAFAGPLCILLVFIPHPHPHPYPHMLLHSLASSRQARGRYLPAA
jgi:hypothetical protein